MTETILEHLALYVTQHGRATLYVNAIGAIDAVEALLLSEGIVAVTTVDDAFFLIRADQIVGVKKG